MRLQNKRFKPLQISVYRDKASAYLHLSLTFGWLGRKPVQEKQKLTLYGRFVREYWTATFFSYFSLHV